MPIAQRIDGHFLVKSQISYLWCVLWGLWVCQQSGECKGTVWLIVTSSRCSHTIHALVHALRIVLVAHSPGDVGHCVVESH